MAKIEKCINIFDLNEKKINLYQISALAILLITLFQFTVNYMNYTQLNSYVLENNCNSISKDSTYPVDSQGDLNSCQVNSDINQYSIKISQLKDIFYSIGASNIIKINVDYNKVEAEGKCKNIEVLEGLSKSKNIKNFNVNTLEEEDGYYLFNITCQIGESV